MSANIDNKDLKRRIIEISYKHKLSHLGSNLTAVDIIKQIYDLKKPDEKFILSSGHAGLALYTVIEQKGGRDAEEIFEHHGVHPDRCTDCGLYCSTGSLGQGLPIAVGMALADRSKNVYCLISDGELAEGSIWEALRICNDQNLNNLKLYVNVNGWGAYNQQIYDRSALEKRIMMTWGPGINRFYWTDSDQLPFLKGQDAHYAVMSEDQHREALEILK